MTEFMNDNYVIIDYGWSNELYIEFFSKDWNKAQEVLENIL